MSKEQIQCFSVKVCEFASKELDTGHTSVDFIQPIFNNIFDANEKFHEKATIWLVKFHNYLIYSLFFYYIPV